MVILKADDMFAVNGKALANAGVPIAVYHWVDPTRDANQQAAQTLELIKNSGLPVLAIFLDSPPGELIEALGEPGALDALWLSLRTSVTALAIIVVVGTPAAYLLATRRFRGRALIITLIELPLVLPPATGDPLVTTVHCGTSSVKFATSEWFTSMVNV